MPRAVRILHLEDDPDDAALLRRALQRAGLEVDCRVCRSRSEFVQGLESPDLELVVCDSGVFDLSGSDALALARADRPEVPFVFLVGEVREEVALAELGAGATDFVSKHDVWRVVAHARRLFARDAPGPVAVADPERVLRLVGTIRALSAARSLDEIVGVVRAAARQLLGATDASLLLRDGDEVVACGPVAQAGLADGERAPIAASFSGRAIVQAATVFSEDITVEPGIGVDPAAARGARSVLASPVRRDDPLGVVVAIWSGHHDVSPSEVTLLEALADSTAVALSHVRAYDDLERRVRERTRALQAANRELETFSYSVSHDLRAPLRHITGYAAALAEDAGDALPADARAHLARIRDAARRMDELIQALLGLSRVARTELRRVRVDLGALAQQIAERLQETEPARHVEVRVAGHLVVDGDAGLLRILLGNLLENAWKYTARVERAVVEVGATLQPDGTTAYFVRDNGAGFDPALADRLFRPFQRLHPPAEFAGNGIGLATVRRILDKHGGQIWAEGEPGVGATFHFVLPPGEPAGAA